MDMYKGMEGVVNDRLYIVSDLVQFCIFAHLKNLFIYLFYF